MKRITYICAILLSSVLMFSCSDYLEAPPSVDLDEDGVFADRTLTEQYITGIYAEGMPLGFSMGSSGIDRKLCATSTLAGACDEAEQGADQKHHRYRHPQGHSHHIKLASNNGGSDANGADRQINPAGCNHKGNAKAQNRIGS